MPEPTLTAAAALDAIDEGVLVQDSETHVVYANRAASELLGVDREDLRGRSELPMPSECLSESGEALPERWPGADALRTGRPQRPCVMGLQRPDGGMRWVRVSARPIGRSVLTSLLDVTALRNAEEDAATLASRLSGDRRAKRADGNGNGNGHKAGKGNGKSVLSPREHQVVELLASGNTGEEVAERLGISPATVRVHVRNATGKLGASTRTQAVAIAVARGEVAAP
ncbi:MAG TPA: PAS and helix-turn-helix domain-containing protein [Solirubrobacteraceae bacterium]